MEKYIKNVEKNAENLKIELENEIKKYKKLEKKTNKELKYYNLIKKGSKESLFNVLFEKDKEIQKLKLKLSRYPFELNKGEKLMTINFESFDENIKNYSIICKNSDIFIDIEKKLYEDYNEYYNIKSYFTINGNKIHKFKSLDENKINNNDIIVLNMINT